MKKKRKEEKKGVLLDVHLKNNFESSNFSILLPVDVAMATLMLYNYLYEAAIVIYI